MRLSVLAWLLILYATGDRTLWAQSENPPSLPEATESRGVLEREFFRDVWRDQKAIFLSPVRVAQGKHLLPVLGFIGVTAGLLASDPDSAKAFAQTNRFDGFNRVFNSSATNVGIIGAAGAFYLGGKIADRPYAQDTGRLALQAFVDTSILVHVLKLSTQRPRPDSYPNPNAIERGFGDGGLSFPSGHSMSAWGVATVVAERYRDKPLVRYGSYALAGTVSFSRLTLGRHFVSDMVVGAVFGHLIGRYVVSREGKRSRLLVMPVARPGTRTMGLSVSYSF